MFSVPVTVLIAARNEAANIRRCIEALQPAKRVVLLDSQSTDDTAKTAKSLGAEVIQFYQRGGYPKKRQWALENLSISTDWVLLLDADEAVPPELWNEIAQAISRPEANAFLIRKGFHFLGRRFRFGGFSHEAVLLFRHGRARFERLIDEDTSGFDMEVHERLIVQGRIDRLRTPLIHEDFKGLQAYRARHEQYAIWEAKLRHNFLATGKYGETTISPRLFGNAQERRRWLKKLVIRLPVEPLVWFLSHYVIRGGCLEGRAGFTASLIRAQYIADVRRRVRALGREPTSKLPRSSREDSAARQTQKV